MIAAIDIGSNAIRLLIKDESAPDFLLHLDEVAPHEYYERVPLKSGMDVFEHGQILPKTELVLTAAMIRFAALMQQHGVGAYRACATSAYRDAANGAEVMVRVNAASGLNVEIIPGAEEARVTRCSYQVPAQWQDDALMFVDVGGGSTEVSLLIGGEEKYSHSFQIGSMRYLCGIQDSAQEQMLDQTIIDIARTYGRVHYLGVGGCVKFMNKYLNGKREGNTIRVEEMQAVYEDLKTKSVDEIVEAYSLPHERADILTPASSIFLRIAHNVGATEITVPSIGVRNGILTELFRQKTVADF